MSICFSQTGEPILCVFVCTMVLARVWKVLESVSLANATLAGMLSFCRNESHYPGLSQDFTGIPVIKKRKRKWPSPLRNLCLASRRPPDPNYLFPEIQNEAKVTSAKKKEEKKKKNEKKKEVARQKAAFSHSGQVEKTQNDYGPRINK